jgi:purine-nucleoside phosphorylase
MKSLFDQVTETAAFIKESCPEQPEIGIVLGSGLGGLAEEIEEIWSKPYSEIVHFPVSTVKGHGGRLIIGRWAGKIIVAMSGRFHYYEGYSGEGSSDLQCCRRIDGRHGSRGYHAY